MLEDQKSLRKSGSKAQRHETGGMLNKSVGGARCHSATAQESLLPLSHALPAHSELQPPYFPPPYHPIHFNPTHTYNSALTLPSNLQTFSTPGYNSPSILSFHPSNHHFYDSSAYNPLHNNIQNYTFCAQNLHHSQPHYRFSNQHTTYQPTFYYPNSYASQYSSQLANLPSETPRKQSDTQAPHSGALTSLSFAIHNFYPPTTAISPGPSTPGNQPVLKETFTQEATGSKGLKTYSDDHFHHSHCCFREGRHHPYNAPSSFNTDPLQKEQLTNEDFQVLFDFTSSLLS